MFFIWPQRKSNLSILIITWTGREISEVRWKIYLKKKKLFWHRVKYYQPLEVKVELTHFFFIHFGFRTMYKEELKWSKTCYIKIPCITASALHPPLDFQTSCRLWLLILMGIQLSWGYFKWFSKNSKDL